MKILLAVDGSEHSARTVETMGAHPWPSGSLIRVLSVVEQVVTATPEVAIFSAQTIEAERDQLFRTADELTTRFANWLCSNGLVAEKQVGRGDAKTVILQEAEEWGADLIVVGSYGHTGFKRWLLGSVAQSIVSQAPCSVYVVRERREKQIAEEDPEAAVVTEKPRSDAAVSH